MSTCAIFAVPPDIYVPSIPLSKIREPLQHCIDALIAKGVDRLVLQLQPGIEMMVAEYALILLKEWRIKKLITIEPQPLNWVKAPVRDETKLEKVMSYIDRKNILMLPADRVETKRIHEILDKADRVLVIDSKKRTSQIGLVLGYAAYKNCKIDRVLIETLIALA